MEEADRMGEYFIETKCEPFLVQSLFNLVILNVLWTIVAGKRLVIKFLIKTRKQVFFFILDMPCQILEFRILSDLSLNLFK